MAQFIKRQSLSEQRKQKPWTLQDVIAFYGQKPEEAKTEEKKK